MVSIFTRSNIVLVLAGAFAAVSLAAAVACDPSSSPAEGTATPVKQPATQVVEVNATTTSDPTAVPSAAAPRILWMAETHAGAGAITVDIETDVPTTATVSLFSGRAGDTTQYPGPESDSQAATHHTISIGTGGVPGVVRAVVTDAAGKTATGELGTTSRADAQFWALGTFAPTLSQQGLAATATWRTMNASGDHERHAGRGRAAFEAGGLHDGAGVPPRLGHVAHERHGRADQRQRLGDARAVHRLPGREPRLRAGARGRPRGWRDRVLPVRRGGGFAAGELVAAGPHPRPLSHRGGRGDLRAVQIPSC